MKPTSRLLLCICFIFSGLTRPIFSAETLSPSAYNAAAGGDEDKPSGVAAIEINSPAADFTSHVSQYELQIRVNDEDIDDVMVAVYTPTSGSKPSTARVLEVKRSDKGKKSIVIALAEGANRIEVTDLKRSDVKEVRTITYQPLGDVLNSAATSGGDEVATSAATPTPTPAGTAVICGQLQLASLDRTLAFIKTTPELGDLAARFRSPGDPRRSFISLSATQKNRDNATSFALLRAKDDYLIRSRLGDKCEDNSSVTQDGLQRAAVVDLLKATLMRLDADLTPKETEINKIALSKERTYLLQNTTTDPDIASEAEKPLEGDVLRKKEKNNTRWVETGSLRPLRGSGFSTLSSVTLRKQIVLLEQYLGNIEVQLRDDAGKVVARTVTDRDGNFKFNFEVPHSSGGAHSAAEKALTKGAAKLTGKTKDSAAKGGARMAQANLKQGGEASATEGGGEDDGAAAEPSATGAETKENSETASQNDLCKYSVTTDADEQYTERRVCVVGGKGTRVNIVLDDRPVSLLTRAIVGFEQSGAAAAKSDQNYFFDVFVSNSFPFKQKINPDFGERLRLWGDFRIASVPQLPTSDLTVGGLVTGFATQVSGLKVREAAHVFEFLGGFEYRLTGNNALLPSFDRATKQKFSISLIGAFGSTTPLDSAENKTTYKVFADAPGLPPEAKGKEFITFVRPDRDRFFRQYYAGVRVQTFFFSPFNIPTQRFPAQFDLTIGQNEFVTGGRFRGPVIRMEGFFPLPYERLKFINLFATAMMKPGHSNVGTPLILQPAPADTIVLASNVLVYALPQPNRDYYRIGFGIDIVSFMQKFKGISGSPGK